MKKIILCLLSILLLCGCSAKIDLVLTYNNNLEENILIWNEWASFSNNSSFDDVIKSYRQSYDNILKENDYHAKYSILNEVIQGEITSSEHNLKNIPNSFAFQQLFQNIEVEKKENGKKYTLFYNEEAISFFEDTLGIGEDESMFFDKIELNIQFHNVVTENNSNSYDSNRNTYTWLITKDNLNRNIEFILTNEKRYDIIIPYFVKRYLSYLILGSFILVVLIFILILAYKSKKANEI